MCLTNIAFNVMTNIMHDITVDHFGASWKAVIARSLTFEPRQIEGWAWWQNWPISCALQLCCWVEDLKTNISG